MRLRARFALVLLARFGLVLLVVLLRPRPARAEWTPLARGLVVGVDLGVVTSRDRYFLPPAPDAGADGRLRLLYSPAGRYVIGEPELSVRWSYLPFPGLPGAIMSQEVLAGGRLTLPIWIRPWVGIYFGAGHLAGYIRGTGVASDVGAGLDLLLGAVSIGARVDVNRVTVGEDRGVSWLSTALSVTFATSDAGRRMKGQAR
jgi:hypothetical protein